MLLVYSFCYDGSDRYSFEYRKTRTVMINQITRSHFANKISRFLNLEAGEAPLLFFSGLYFYLLLCAYYIIRPIRNEMAIQNGIDNIQWLLLAAAAVMILITPIFGWLTSRFKTQQFLTICTVFFVSNLVVFFVLFEYFSELKQSLWVSRSFYVWVNIFNLFIISLFWSYMNDSFSKSQAKRLFSAVSAGGTAGALTGPLITTILVEEVGLGYLLLISAVILSLTIICILKIKNIHLVLNKLNTDDSGHSQNEELRQKESHSNDRLKGGILDGIKHTWASPYLRMIASFVIVFAIISTFLSIELARAIEHVFQDSAQRTKLFSLADLAVNSLTLFLQVFLTGRLIKWISYKYTLLILPVILTIGFILIGFAPTFTSLIILSILSRAGKYAILNPTSEMLFSIVNREEKYKAKNFIDTAILRSSNVFSSWLITAIKSLGAGGHGVLIFGAVLGSVLCVISNWLGNKYEESNENES